MAISLIFLFSSRIMESMRNHIFTLEDHWYEGKKTYGSGSNGVIGCSVGLRQ